MKGAAVWLDNLGDGEHVLKSYRVLDLPLPVRLPKRLAENNALRGVGSCGLHDVSLSVVEKSLSCMGLPVVNVKVLRQVCGKTSRRRRAANGFQTEIIGRRFVHGHVFEVEIAWTISELASTVSSEHVLSFIPATPWADR